MNTEGPLPPDLERIVREHGTALLRLGFLYLKDYHLAEDALQDTLLKVYRSYPSFRGECSEKTWITRIAINVLKNHLRSSWWRRVDSGQALAEIPAPEPDTRERDDALLSAVMELPAKYREVVLLYYYQGFRQAEIAALLRVAESTVAVRLSRARARMRQTLKGVDPDDPEIQD